MINFLATSDLEKKLFEESYDFTYQNHSLKGQGQQYHSFIQVVIARYHQFTDQQYQLTQLLSQFRISSTSISNFCESLQRLALSSNVSTQLQWSLPQAVPSPLITHFASLFSGDSNLIPSALPRQNLFQLPLSNSSDLLARRRIYGRGIS
jgi:hypothetical protein